MSDASKIEVTVYSDGSTPDAVDAVVNAFGQYDTNGVDVEQTSGDLDDVLRAAVNKAKDTEGTDLIVIVTRNGDHDDRQSATDSFQALADDDNFVLVVTTGNPSGDDAEYLRWADDDAPFAHRVDVLSVDELPGTEVPDWARKVLA